MKLVLLWRLLIAALPLSAVADDYTDCPASLPAAVTAESACKLDDEVCRVWHRFRQERPYPYQAISLMALPGSGRVTLIFSELPPLGAVDQMGRLMQAVFGVGPEELHRLRYAVGLDGWLEDWVLTLPYERGETTEVAAAHGGTVELPLKLAEQLQFLSTAIFGASGMLYVDLLTAPTAREALPNLQITTGELQHQASSTEEKWQSLLEREAPLRAFSQLMRSSPALFMDQRRLLLALAIPPSTEMRSLRALFRQFALSSDLIVGAVRPKKGGLILLARSRVVSLRALPPVRFETFSALAGASSALGQSYERQRVFAGKIRAGVHTGWDWAPIYLSPQLQDTEFGTLLNIADQQLKSWSQCGNVRYAAFSYPAPATFPFKTRTASDWFREAASTNELIFNWNTNGFSTASETPAGRIVATSGTAALPVSYIVPSTTHPLLDALAKFREPLASKAQEVAREGSIIGSKYFSSLNDPILARVAQNVLLFQILNDAKPFRDAETPVPPTPSRSDLIASLLLKRTDAWLSTLQQDPRMSATSGAQAIRMLKTKAGMTKAQIAQLLAQPEKHQQELLRLGRSIELRRIALLQLDSVQSALIAEYKDVSEKARAEFIGNCRQLAGRLEREADGLTCHHTRKVGSTEPILLTPYLDRRKQIEVELQLKKQELEDGLADFKRQREVYLKLAEQGQAAEAVAGDLRGLASYSSDLDRILDDLLMAAKRTASQGSIQTPTVVLSQDVASRNTVGGHNIDALPWLTKVDAATVQARLRVTGDRPELIIPKSGTENSASIARAIATVRSAGSPPVPAVTRELDAALHVPAGPRASFLEKLAQRSTKPVIDPELAQRAKLCACDIYMEASGPDTILAVKVRPPPPGPPHILFGDSAAVQHLMPIAANKTVVFANLSAGRATSISESAARGLGDFSKKGLMEEQIAIAHAFFRHPVDSVGKLIAWRTKQGSSVAVHGAKGETLDKLAQALKSRPKWPQASARESASALNGSGKVVLVEVRYGSNAPRNIEVHTYGVDGVRAVPPVASTNIALARIRAGDTLQVGLGKLAEQISQDAKDIRAVEFFFQSTGLEAARRHWPSVPQPEAALALATQ